MYSSEIAEEKIYLEYCEKVTHYISSRISNPHEVEDLVSTVFLKVYQKLPSFDENKASVSTWIYTITRNTLTDYFRTLKQPCELTENLPSDVEIDDNLLREEMLNSLADALSRLEQRERDLIILHYYSGKTLKTIAEMMQMSYANARIIHNKALAKLRTLLTPQA